MPMLSGIIWPIEAMPVWLQHISVILPMTLPAQSIRAIMGRGMYHPSYTIDSLYENNMASSWKLYSCFKLWYSNNNCSVQIHKLICC